jgi:signal transduction histidine kinase
MNGQMQRMIDDVRRMSDEKSEIMGIVAHDLKNPITSIQGVAEALLDYSGGDAMIHAFTSEILKTSQRMFALVKNLLDVNAIENGALMLSISGMDTRLYVEAAVEKHAHAAVLKDITFVSTIPDEEMIALADELALIQVLDNLLSNAVKYSPFGARVWVTVKRERAAASNSTLRDNGTRHSTALEQPCIHIVVCDEGPGLTEKDKERLFQKFARLSAQPTAGEHSTGLGLSIVKRLVELMRGNVWCESKYGAGAEFTVQLRCADEVFPTNGMQGSMQGGTQSGIFSKLTLTSGAEVI